MNNDRNKAEMITAAQRNEDSEVVLDGGSSAFDPLLPAVRSTPGLSSCSKAGPHNKPAAANPT